MFPNFLIIGAQKAGTTWLHRNLLVHPQIWMPKEKELHYFDEKIQAKFSLVERFRGDKPHNKRWRRQANRQVRRYRKEFSLKDLGFLKDLAWDLRYFLGTPDDKWYAMLFKQGRGKITGEATPDYSILDKEVIAHVHELMPETKIIFLMRNPIERAWSQVLMELREQSPEAVPDEKFYRHLGNKRSWLFTDYLRTLENWGSFYPEDQIFVGFLEDIHFYPNLLLKRLYRFLGADPSVEYRVIKRKIHSRAVETMPTRIASHLADSYREDIRRLSERFGGYASFWLYCAERLIENPPTEETIPYPLWESSLWEDWLGACGQAPPMGSREAEPQSGLLSAFS